MTKFKISNVLVIEYWNLEFICYLGIVIWDLNNHILEKEELNFNSRGVGYLRRNNIVSTWMTSS